MFEDVMVDGIGLVGLNIAIVQRAKMFGMQGKALLGLSTGIGLVLGFVYKVQRGFPTTLEEWVATVVFSVAMAVVPSGLVDVVRDTGKQIVRYATGKVNLAKRLTGVM